MDKELKELLFEIDDTFDRLNSRIKSIKNIKEENIGFIWDFYQYLKLDFNYLNYYARALRDKLENG